MEKELIESLEDIKKNVDAIEPFDMRFGDINCELKWKASGLLFELIKKLKSE